MVQEGLSYLDQTLLDPENKNTYLYNGKEQDAQTKFFEYGFRDYDAQIGRWHVRDALAESTFSVSPYAYGNNNPINNIDVAGLMFVPVEQGPEISSGFGADLGRMLDDSRGSITGMSTDHGGGGGGGSGGGGHYEVGPSVRVLREWVATGRIGSLTEYWNSVEKGESIEEYLADQVAKGNGTSVTLEQAICFIKTGKFGTVGVDALEMMLLNPTDGGGWYYNTKTYAMEIFEGGKEPKGSDWISLVGMTISQVNEVIGDNIWNVTYQGEKMFFNESLGAQGLNLAFGTIADIGEETAKVPVTKLISKSFGLIDLFGNGRDWYNGKASNEQTFFNIGFNVLGIGGSWQGGIISAAYDAGKLNANYRNRPKSIVEEVMRKRGMLK